MSIFWLSCLPSALAYDAGLVSAESSDFCDTLMLNRLSKATVSALHQLSGTHYRKLFSVVTLLQF